MYRIINKMHGGQNKNGDQNPETHTRPAIREICLGHYRLTLQK